MGHPRLDSLAMCTDTAYCQQAGNDRVYSRHAGGDPSLANFMARKPEGKTDRKIMSSKDDARIYFSRAIATAPQEA